jgi:hypothetical protein
LHYFAFNATGKAAFALNIVPFVDYRIVAQSQLVTGCRGETTINIINPFQPGETPISSFFPLMRFLQP